MAVVGGEKWKVIFVLGGPGSGKGTQCAKIVEKFGYIHLSAGDLLRAERKSGSPLAEMINSYIQQGALVPAEVTVRLIKQAMETVESSTVTFLIDGFPRSTENLDCFNRDLLPLCDLQCILFFDCPLDVLEQRLLNRGKSSGRDDDNIAVIKKRFKTYADQTIPVVDMCEKDGLVIRVNAKAPVDVVFKYTCLAVYKAQGLPPPADECTARVSKPGAAASEKEMVQYFAESVDPIFAPLMRRILVERPDDVKSFVVEELQAVVKTVVKHPPLVISGPSGAGKGTIIDLIMKAFPGKFCFSVSHTTRAPRGKEVDGIHYHFVTRDTMEREIAAGKFIEYAEVHGNFYGTSLSAVERIWNSGKICILDIDIQGVKQVKASPLSPRFLFISPPSLEVLEQRLSGRGTESADKIAIRMKNASEEMAFGTASGNMDLVYVNNSLAAASDDMSKQMLEWYPSI